MKKTTVALLLLVAALVAVPLLVYGTLNPCGWLYSEMYWYALQKAKEPPTVWELAGARAIEAHVYTLGPIECLTRYLEVKRAGGVAAYRHEPSISERDPYVMSEKEREHFRVWRECYSRYEHLGPKKAWDKCAMSRK